MDNLDDHELLAQQSNSGEEDSDTMDAIPFSQSELNDLIRDLGLPKESGEFLGAILKDIYVASEDIIFLFSIEEKEFVTIFSQEGELVFCYDVPGLLVPR